MPTILNKIGARLMGAELDRLQESVSILHDAYLDVPYVIPPSTLHRQLAEVDSQLLDLYIGQLGYEIIGGDLLGYGRDTAAERLRAVEEGRRLFKYDVITQWAINTWTNYGFGETIEIEPVDEAAALIFDLFWQDDRNSAVLADDKLAHLSNDTLVDGEIFKVYFIGVDGFPTIRIIPTEEISEIVTAPGDASTKLWYKRQYQEDGELQTLYYPDWQVYYSDPEALNSVSLPLGARTTLDATEENRYTYAVVQHVAHNLKRPQRNTSSSISLRGWPLTTSAAPWSRAHKRFREDRATVASAVAMYVNTLKHKGGSRATDAIKQRLASTLQTSGSGGSYETNPAAAAGSTFIQNDAVDLARMPLTTGASDAKMDGEALFLMANLALGLFPHYAGAGDAYRLATATAMERPLQMQWSRYQLFWSSQFKIMVKIVLKAHERATGITFKNYDARVSTDRLVEVDLDSLSKSISALYRDTLVPLAELGAIPDNTIKIITANVWRIVLQALGVADVSEVAADEAFGVDTEWDPGDEDEDEDDDGDNDGDEDRPVPFPATELGESHSAESVQYPCPLCDGTTALRFPGHKNLLVCASCSRTFDPEVE